MKLEDCLKIHADSQPDKVAVIYKDESLSYRDLYQRVLAKTNDLLAIGCLQGTAFCFKNTQDIEFLITYFAVHLLGGIAVPLEKEIADDKFNYIQDEYYDFRPSEDVADILYTTLSGHLSGSVPGRRHGHHRGPGRGIDRSPGGPCRHP